MKSSNSIDLIDLRKEEEYTRKLVERNESILARNQKILDETKRQNKIRREEIGCMVALAGIMVFCIAVIIGIILGRYLVFPFGY